MADVDISSKGTTAQNIANFIDYLYRLAAGC